MKRFVIAAAVSAALVSGNTSAGVLYADGEVVGISVGSVFGRSYAVEFKDGTAVDLLNENGKWVFPFADEQSVQTAAFALGAAIWTGSALDMQPSLMRGIEQVVGYIETPYRVDGTNVVAWGPQNTPWPGDASIYEYFLPIDFDMTITSDSAEAWRAPWLTYAVWNCTAGCETVVDAPVEASVPAPSVLLLLGSGLGLIGLSRRRTG